MSTFQVRVEDIIGSVSDVTAIGDWLTEGARIIINKMPENKIEKFSMIPLSDTGNGISVNWHRPIRAHKSGYGARYINAGLKTQASNSESIHYAGTTDPAWYIELGKAFVIPSGGTIIAIAYPINIFASDSSIIDFPIEYEYLVVLYASVRGRLRQMTDLTVTTLSGISISSITKPTAPSIPVFSYADASVGTISSTSISFSDTLNYIAPVFGGSYANVDTALTNQDIELSSAHLNKVNSQLETMQKELLVSLNEFNKDKGEFDANLQIAISDAQLTQQRLIRAVELASDTDKQNQAQKLQQQVQEYQSLLAKYGQEISVYGQEINQEISRVSTLINLYNTQFQQYAVGLEGLRQEFQTSIKEL